MGLLPSQQKISSEIQSRRPGNKPTALRAVLRSFACINYKRNMKLDLNMIEEKVTEKCLSIMMVMMKATEIQDP